jgi:cytidyltransferase-like protein
LKKLGREFNSLFITMKTVAIAGHFNPIHVGHLQLIDAARNMGDKLIVIVANDTQAGNKRKPVLIPLQERMMLVSRIKGVDEVIASIDLDTTIKETLKLVKPDVLASGCDENHPDAIEEAEICYNLGIQTKWNVGGNKIRSSSIILNNYKNEKGNM